MTVLLELHDLSLAFGGLQVIKQLDLVVEEGEIVSLIGPNGAGKTTVFNLITGVYEPDAGDILLAGRSLCGLPPHKRTKLGVSRTFQTLRLFLNMTVKENVMAAPGSGSRCCGRRSSGTKSGRCTRSRRRSSPSSAGG